MSDEERYRIAKAYLDRQLKRMEKNGLRVKKISEHEYETIVKQVAQAVRSSGTTKKAAISSASHV